MKFRHELTYDASPAEVFEMLADPAFREASAAAMGVVSAEVDLTRTGDGFSLTIDQVQLTDDLPSFARTFAGQTTRAIQREEWADPTGATLRIETPGKPAEMKGTITLRADGAGTCEVVELDVRVKMPLIGGKLEKLMAAKVEAGLVAEQGAGTAWLAGER